MIAILGIILMAMLSPDCKKANSDKELSIPLLNIITEPVEKNLNLNIYKRHQEELYLVNLSRITENDNNITQSYSSENSELHDIDYAQELLIMSLSSGELEYWLFANCIAKVFNIKEL